MIPLAMMKATPNLPTHPRAVTRRADQGARHRVAQRRHHELQGLAGSPDEGTGRGPRGRVTLTLELLGVGREAARAEIRRAFHELDATFPKPQITRSFASYLL